MKFNYAILFPEYKINFGSIKSTVTVDNIKLVIESNNKYLVNINQLAYILATAYHESAHDFIPKYEFGKLEYFVKKYWLNSKVAKWLGNDDAQDAFKYRGRGLVQITGEGLYTKFGIQDNPDKALEIETAIDIMCVGMLGGRFTGVGLRKYVKSDYYDYKEARRVVNGTDKALLIAGYAEKFRIILNKSLM